MCGRYVRRGDKQKIAEYFHATPQPAELPMPGADYNIAPTTFQPIIRQSRELGDREMILARWGLVPFFTKDFEGHQGSLDDQCACGVDHDGPDLAGAVQEAPLHHPSRRFLLRPFESEEMEVYEANPKVGNVRNNGPEMMKAAAKAAEDGELPL